MIRVLLDEALPLRAAQLLRRQGVDAVHARERGLASAPDSAVLALARLEASPSVVLLRMDPAGHTAVAEAVTAVIAGFGAELVAGAVATMSHRGVRLRLLPLKP